MNTFTKDPDNPAAIAGCVLWFLLLAGVMALLFTGLSRIGG